MADLHNKDILGKAILDYHNDSFKGPFLIHYTTHSPDDMPMDVFFRELEDMPIVEQHALAMVSGTVLDVGAGAGSHALELQRRGIEVVGLDYSEDCVRVMQERGVINTICADVFKYSDRKFDTALLLMNGIGLARKLENLPNTIETLLDLLNPGGQILFDSSDVSYLFQDRVRPDGYLGEVQSSFHYDGEKGGLEPWLYVDPETLIKICDAQGFNLEILLEDETGLYLARITK